MHDGDIQIKKDNAAIECLVVNLVRKVVLYIFLGQKVKKLYFHYGSWRPFWKTWIAKIAHGRHLQILRNLQTGGLGSSILQRKNYILQVQVYHHGCRTIFNLSRSDILFNSTGWDLGMIPRLPASITTHGSISTLPSFNKAAMISCRLASCSDLTLDPLLLTFCSITLTSHFPHNTSFALKICSAVKWPNTVLLIFSKVELCRENNIYASNGSNINSLLLSWFLIFTSLRS